jgi:hypothetical protein
MLTALRRMLLAAQYPPSSLVEPIRHESSRCRQLGRGSRMNRESRDWSVVVYRYDVIGTDQATALEATVPLDDHRLVRMC